MSAVADFLGLHQFGSGVELGGLREAEFCIPVWNLCERDVKCFAEMGEVFMDSEES